MKRSAVIPIILVALIAALVVGYSVGRSGRTIATTGIEAPTRQIYTCSMHPQIRSDKPGPCPICGMPLILAISAQSSSDATPTLMLSDYALAMASVETSPVAYRELSSDLRAVGTIRYNEPALATITARTDGYAEKLFVNVTGVDIKAGDHLVEVYSPDLLVGQQELLIALQDGQAGPLVETAKLKLRRWGLTDAQIGDLVNSRKVTDRVTLYSPITGTVIEKNITENTAFKAGDMLYRIANLDTVWVYLDIYESDLALVRYGQKVTLTAEAYPGHVFTGIVNFVEPLLNEQTRTVRVPVQVENVGHMLKPGMYVSAVIHAALGPDGRAAPTGVEGKYTCPMHPQVLKDAAGPCPLCGMPLEQVPGATAPHEHATTPADQKTASEKETRPGPLAVPMSAVLDSGTRRLVFVEKGRGTFESRDVTLGPRCGDFFPVLDGLTAGDRVVTRGGFFLDSQLQIMGQPSLFYPGGLHAEMGHQHGGTAPAAPPSVEHKH